MGSGASQTVGEDLREVLYGLLDLLSKGGFALVLWASLSRSSRRNLTACLSRNPSQRGSGLPT